MQYESYILDRTEGCLRSKLGSEPSILRSVYIISSYCIQNPQQASGLDKRTVMARTRLQLPGMA